MGRKKADAVDPGWHAAQLELHAERRRQRENARFERAMKKAGYEHTGPRTSTETRFIRTLNATTIMLPGSPSGGNFVGPPT